MLSTRRRANSDRFFTPPPPASSIACSWRAQPINAEEVAKAIGVGLRTLQLNFNKILGRPVSAEIQRVRIERGKRELVQSNRTIQDIARDTGFGKPMRMYTAFRRELGTTPRDYRKQRQLSGQQ